MEKMEYQILRNKIVLVKEDGSTAAEVDFPDANKDGTVVDVCHTYVDNSLRGQGIAGILMEKLTEELKRTGRKAKLSCSYAVKWFEKHDEEQELLG